MRKFFKDYIWFLINLLAVLLVVASMFLPIILVAIFNNYVFCVLFILSVPFGLTIATFLYEECGIDIFDWSNRL